MDEISPDLAKKVVAADLRNLIKKVGDGGTLTTAERDLFTEFSRADDDPLGLRATRVNALLKRWLAGQRRTPEELAEIAHIIGAPPPPPLRNTEATADEQAAALGLNRRTFYRWLAAGVEHKDPLPIGEPGKIVDWYERMRLRGVFKQKLRASFRAAAAAGKAAAAAKAAPPVTSPSAAKPATNGETSRLYNSEAAGLAKDIAVLESLITGLREDAARLHARGEVDESKRMIQQCIEMIDRVTIFKTRLIKLEENEEVTVRKQHYEEDLSRFMPSIVSNLLHMGARLFGKIKTEVPRAEFLALFRHEVVTCFSEMRHSKFSPPLVLE